MLHTLIKFMASLAGGQRTRQVEYTMPLKKNALGPSEAYNVELYTVAHKEPGGWVVNIEVNTPKVRMVLLWPGI